jgi:L-ascorbate metabolism protein UlaG (beta-lactamase superfamily)
MTLKSLLFTLFIIISNITWSQKTDVDIVKTMFSSIKIKPILHSSFVLTHMNKTIYVDPYGGADLYKGLDAPDIILITDIHGDHLNQTTLDSINTSKATFIVPKAVALKLPSKYSSQIVILENGETILKSSYYIKAIPMYNLPEETDSKHPKGRGNGYVINADDKVIYISGDTEDITEMRKLQNIDIAFICMNLPYTMDINQAASAVLEFQPKIVFPFHYRGKNGFSDVEEFKNIINAKNKNIDVRLRQWYPNN